MSTQLSAKSLLEQGQARMGREEGWATVWGLAHPRLLRSSAEFLGVQEFQI